MISENFFTYQSTNKSLGLEKKIMKNISNLLNLSSSEVSRDDLQGTPSLQGIALLGGENQ